MTRPTFLRVGVPKTKTRPPTTVRPPTSSGAAPSLDPLGWQSYLNTVAGSSFNLPYETGVAGDIIIIISLVGLMDPGNYPSGFTELVNYGNDGVAIHYRVADGTEGGTAAFTNSSKGLYASNRLYANGATLDVNDWVHAGNAGGINPPSVALGDAEYAVLAILQSTLSGASDTITAPTGYTSRVYEPGFEVASWTGMIADRSVTGPGTEDPATFTVSSSLGSNSATLAIPLTGAAPSVSAPGHTHLEADVTDLDHWTEADHDALDHTGLTGVGGGSVNDLSDATITGTPADNELFAYDSGTSEWINQTAAEAGLAVSGHTHASSGSGELLMQDGVTAPPVPIETEARDDWLYED